ncbi:MAG: cyclic nucleotide-binding domain-containing protein [Alphaproteobacteria bacterium]|nr:cyclic nucleotide-binding domain-containing protein [Alphaproteobacteria bacterium]
MAFMAAFTDEQRRLFEAAAEVLEVPRGEMLLRRGEPGGDLFLVRNGKLEAVDNRVVPEVIISVLAPGAVVGEMAFLDGSPRSADVRAAEDAVVLRWAHHDLRALLRREPVFAAAFYETVAQLASTRLRRATHTAMTGVISQRAEEAAGGRAHAEGRALADMVKAALLRSETQLRIDPNDAGAEEALRDELNNLRNRLNDLMEAWPEAQARDAVTQGLQRELHPYLVRSTLADRSIRRPQGVVATAETLSHVLVGRASGEGRLGEILDQWLLGSPTLTAIRELTSSIPAAAAERLPTNRNRRVLLLNAGTGSLVARLAHQLDQAPTTITVVDPSRSALSFLDTDVVPIDANIDVVAVQENLAEFAVGRMRHTYQAQDLVIIHGLLEYMPDRLAVSLLTTAGGLLNEHGAVVTAALSESADQHFLDRLLRWPTIRRSQDALARVHRAARFRPARFADTTAPAVLLTADAPVAPPRLKR